MEPLKAAVIGCGNISDIYFKMAPRFEVLKIAVCADLREEAAAAKAAQYGVVAKSVEEALGDPDVDMVINLTVPLAHKEVNLRALAAGKHVYAEKPLATTVADGQEILAVAAEKRLRIGCAPDSFLGGAHQLARALIDDGVIGRVVAGTAIMASPGMESWHPNPDFFFKAGGGPVLDVGVYYITALVNMLGPVASVTASEAISFPQRTITSEPLNGTKIDVEVPTHVTGALTFANGAIVTLIASWDVQKHTHTPLEIYGAAASMLVPDPNFFGGTVRIGKGREDWVAHEPEGFAFVAPNPEAGGQSNYRVAGAADMAWGIRQDRPHRASGELAYHVLEVMEALHQAAGEERHVTISSTCERPAALPRGAFEDVLSGG